ncbi:MAG: exodeoxyribonuclease III [Thermoplasmata archaeon]|nr:exodeoxyribonuclease III [Thermoplasmata archaeon]
MDAQRIKIQDHAILLSWNVNGIRAVVRKGFMEWFAETRPDVLCIQETKAGPDQVPSAVAQPPGYHAYWNPAERKGYSGTVTYTRIPPEEVIYGLGEERFDREGRTVITDYGGWVLFNVYFPNGKRSEERLRYKLNFYDKFLEVADRYRRRGKGVVVCGDFNTAHRPIDLARPRENENVSGFLPVEREWIDRFISHGYTDTFRRFHPDEKDRYSWWDYKSRARERNVGWRIDYFFVSNDLLPRVQDAFIMDRVMGSDHCPVGITLDVSGL